MSDIFFVFRAFFTPIVPVEEVCASLLRLDDCCKVDSSVAVDSRSGGFNFLDQFFVVACPCEVFIWHKDSDVSGWFPGEVLVVLVLTGGGRSGCFDDVVLEVLGDEASNKICHKSDPGVLAVSLLESELRSG